MDSPKRYRLSHSFLPKPQENQIVVNDSGYHTATPNSFDSILRENSENNGSHHSISLAEDLVDVRHSARFVSSTPQCSGHLKRPRQLIGGPGIGTTSLVDPTHNLTTDPPSTNTGFKRNLKRQLAVSSERDLSCRLKKQLCVASPVEKNPHDERLPGFINISHLQTDETNVNCNFDKSKNQECSHSQSNNLITHELDVSERLSDGKRSDFVSLDIIHLAEPSASRPRYTQKLGTPEKNKILYPELRPVTPPKKLKSPEKELPKRTLKKRTSLEGREFVDFFKMLSEVGVYPDVIKMILSKLSSRDLMNVSQVSTAWRKVFLFDPVAKRRRERQRRRIQQSKENVRLDAVKKERQEAVLRSCSERRELVEIQVHRNVMMSSASASEPRSPPTSPSSRKHKQYSRVASLDMSVKLRKCPKCMGPARLQGSWAYCQGLSCSLRFCWACQAAHPPPPAPPPCQRKEQTPSPTRGSRTHLNIGTRRSHRNLRRLLKF